MRKQKNNKLIAKVFIAVFIINTVFILGFTSNSLATTTLSVEASPDEVYIYECIAISWETETLPSPGGDSSYGGYYSKLYKSINGEYWQYVAKINGLGDQIYNYQPNEIGDHRFKIEEYASKIYYPGGSSNISPEFVGTGISNTVQVNCLPSVTTKELIVSCDSDEVCIYGDINILWDPETLPNPDPYISYGGYYSEIYMSTDNGQSWQFLTKIDGLETNVYNYQTYEIGNYLFLVKEYVSKLLYPGGSSNIPLELVGIGTSNTVQVNSFPLSITPLTINSTSKDVYINDYISLSWETETFPSPSSDPDDYISYGEYYSNLYMSNNNGQSWEYIAKIDGLGNQIYSYQPNEIGFHLFMVKEFASEILFPGGSSNISPQLVGIGISKKSVIVFNMHTTPDFIDYSTLTNNDSVREVTLSWNVEDLGYDDHYSKIYQQINSLGWEEIDDISGTGQKSTNIPLDKAGETIFKVVKCGHNDGSGGDNIIGEELSNIVDVTGINKYAIIVSGSNIEYDPSLPIYIGIGSGSVWDSTAHRYIYTGRASINLIEMALEFINPDIPQIPSNLRNFDAIQFAKTLVENYYYSIENTFLLMNPTVDYREEVLDIYLGNYTGDYIPASIENLNSTFHYVSTHARKFDEVIVYWNSKAGRSHPHLLEYGDVFVNVSVLDGYLDTIECSEMYLFFDTDYKTAKVLDYVKGNNRIIFTGTGDDPAFSKGHFIDALTYGLMFEQDMEYNSFWGGFRWPDSRLFGNEDVYSFHADTNYAGNSDGHVSMYELWEFSLQETIRLRDDSSYTANAILQPHKWVGSKFSPVDSSYIPPNLYINDGIVTYSVPPAIL